MRLRVMCAFQFKHDDKDDAKPLTGYNLSYSQCCFSLLAAMHEDAGLDIQ